MTQVVPGAAPVSRRATDARSAGSLPGVVATSRRDRMLADLRSLWPQAGEQRDLGLDGLRGLAVLLVVGTHTASSIMPFGGIVGVAAFFVLSGYLITTLLVREREERGHIAYGPFYARRALRLLPALVLVLLATPVLLWAVGDPILSMHIVPSSFVVLFYLSDFFWVAGDGLVVYGHTWSLSVEEQFYLVWPLTVALLMGVRPSRRRLVWGVVLITVGLTVWRYYAAGTMSTHRVQFALDTNAHALALGALLALVPTRLGTAAARAAVLLGSTGLLLFSLLPIVPEAPFHNGFVEYGAPVAALLTAVVLVGLRHTDVLLSWTPLVFFGRISYGLYLWHEILLVTKPGGREFVDLERFPVVALSVVVAVASWVLVEAPALRLKRHFERTRLPG